MKLTKSELKAPVAKASAVTPGKSTLMAATHVLLEASLGQLKATGTNIDTQIISTGAIGSDDSFSAAIPAERLNKILANVADDVPLVLSQDGAKLTIKAGRSKFTLPTIPVRDFPVMDAEGPYKEFAIDGLELKARLAVVLKSAAKQDVRYYLNGVCLDCKDGDLNIVATDERRAAVSVMPMAGDFGFILHRDAVAQLIKTIDGGEVRAFVHDKRVVFSGEDFTFATNTIAARYPDWRRFIPAMSGGASADSATLTAAFVRAGLAENIGRVAGVAVKDKVMTITSQNSNEESSDSLDIDMPDVEFSCRVDQILMALSSFDGPFNFSVSGQQIHMWQGDLRIVVMQMRG
jgi:DNA polymerase-3 subunit beta